MRAGLPVERVAAAAVLLAGPGVLYQVTAVRVRRHDVTVAVLARRTAVAQAALPVVVVGVMVISGGARRVPILADALMPATVTLFFVPALLAQAHEIGRALEALRRLPQAQRGFEVQPPVAVLPVDDGDGDGSS
jgi:Na+/alanine symporter